METKSAALTILFLAAATAVYDLLLSPHLPAMIPTHWNISDQADGYSSKAAAFLLSLAVPLSMLILLYVLPRLPTRLPDRPSQTTNFMTTNFMLVCVSTLMFYTNILIPQFILHPALPFGKLVLTGMLLLFVLLGNVLGKTRRNRWSGIRTPWTLASDQNWIATHRMAGRLWVAVSLAGIVLLWLGLPVSVLLPTVLLPLVVIPVLYSYVLFKRSSGNGEEPA